MMQKNNYIEKIAQLKTLKKSASPDEQLEIDFIIMGMQWAYGENTDEKMHDNRMQLLYSNNLNDKQKGEAYRKGMDVVLYSVRGKKKDPATVILPSLRVDQKIETGLNNIKTFLRIKSTASIRKAALRWYIEMMSETHGKDFIK